MKIISLKFKNINSLAGESEINFSAPKFTDNGLFAITGKTGSGKSSILDAIALALYGKTPRVEITGQSNDVMTRGTNDCYSEIVFEVGGNIWKSSWKQERTRTGNLRRVNRQIADSTNKILVDQVRSCDSKIIEILGLTFEQFTKVIMLAQGSFTAFLQANKNEKGELLEQITGTEIYAEISRKVFERNKFEKEKLEKILVELGAIKIISEEEIDNLNREIADYITQKKQIDNDLEIIETAKKWIIDLEKLIRQVFEAKQKIPELEQKVEGAAKIFQQSETMFVAAKSEKENSEKILVKVRELDVKISEKDKSLAIITQNITELEKIKNNLSREIENSHKNLKEKQNSLQQKEDWGIKNEKYKPLIEQFSVIENQNYEVSSLLTDLNTKKSELESAKKDLETKISIYKKSLTVFAEKEKSLIEKEKELKTKKEDLATLLSGKDINVYHIDKEKIIKFGALIKELIGIENEISENYKDIEKQQDIITSSEKSEKELSLKILNNKNVLENIKNQIDLLYKNKTFQSLEEHRKSLEDGKPCPLCGALEHPYSLGNEPKIDNKETELENLKKQEQQISKTYQQDEKILTKSVSDKENALTNKEKAENHLIEIMKKRETILNELKTVKPEFSIPDTENKFNFLKDIHKKMQDEYIHINTLIIKATESEKYLKKIQEEEIPSLQQVKQTSEKSKTDAETNQKLSEQNLENKTKLLDESDKKYKEKNSALLEIFHNYEVANIETLKKCLTDWNNNISAIENIKEQINNLENTLVLKKSEFENNQTQLTNKLSEKQEIVLEKQTFSTERNNLFGEKRVEQEEKRLKELLENAETTKTSAENSKNSAITELAKNQAIISEKEKELSVKQAENITEKTLEELQVEYAEKKPQSDQLSEKIGANNQALNFNNENLQQNSKKIEEKELQQRSCEKWGRLNELIGSHDGQKYRDFAQALTFEHLTGLANSQLQKMSERYVLKRVGDATNPFDLAVIDKFQNYEERTAQNLSGGEKFIVSLSLALGLSKMASKNMKIDTMFIDEGFGTLDSDYLDVALSALSNLHNEGKLIGVISHLTELKERIATHIEVIPDGKGYSRIG